MRKRRSGKEGERRSWKKKYVKKEKEEKKFKIRIKGNEYLQQTLTF